jgi:hypothetical protein
MMGPKNGAIESVLTIHKTNVPPALLNPANLKLTAFKYMNEKAVQVTAKQGLLLGAEAYETNYRPLNKRAPSSGGRPTYFGMGIRYAVGGQKYIERTYLMKCPKRVLVMKYLSEVRVPRSEVDKILNGFGCR